MNAIHPTAQIAPDVVIGTGNTVGPFVVINSSTIIGNDNWIGAGAVIGATPEVRGWKHPTPPDAPIAGGGVLIGDRNVIREHAQVHQGWAARTILGNDLFVMNQCYVAHDCSIGDGATLASSVLLAGHVTVGEGANLGLGTVVHQRTFLGAGVVVGMGSVVTRDIPPFAKAFGNPARVHGVNLVGMSRMGHPPDSIDKLAALYGSLPVGIDDLRAFGLAHPLMAKAMDSWVASRADRSGTSLRALD
ncbi:UDP-N-acetylglucosamine acyltransferase [Glaciihabitans sp. UYNi722]|uniref:UDP-N-acetylglucosamine acyltransferase n=1 Tax=Glaciihabitans sp. UYNi722 TaxID=3156344 RepID=UPI00339622E3